MIKIGTLNTAYLLSLAVEAQFEAQDTRLVDEAEEASLANLLEDALEEGDAEAVVAALIARCTTPVDSVIAACEAESITFTVEKLHRNRHNRPRFEAVRDQLMNSRFAFEDKGSIPKKIEAVKAAIRALAPLLG